MVRGTSYPYSYKKVLEHLAGNEFEILSLMVNYAFQKFFGICVVFFLFGLCVCVLVGFFCLFTFVFFIIVKEQSKTLRAWTCCLKYEPNS